VSVLGSTHKAIAGRFGAEGRPSARLLLAGEPHHRGPHSGALILDTALAAVECAVRERVAAGDHTVFLADVLGLGEVESGPVSAAPLIRFQGRYRGLAR
jgi:flavin reductase (DIM6/NTAB) family NADH-FMN oxidoreductase RutF